MLRLQIDYNLPEDAFTCQTNVKKSKVGDIVTNFLRLQAGAGEDRSERQERDRYRIDLELDLRNDSFRCRHDCGNLGLRDGILLRFVGKFDRNEIKGLEETDDKKQRPE